MSPAFNPERYKLNPTHHSSNRLALDIGAAISGMTSVENEMWPSLAETTSSNMEYRQYHGGVPRLSKQCNVGLRSAVYDCVCFLFLSCFCSNCIYVIYLWVWAMGHQSSWEKSGLGKLAVVRTHGNK